MPDTTFRAQGDIGTFTHAGGSGAAIDRSFCRACGSPLFSRISARPGLIYLKLGTLDDAGWVRPEINLWCSSALPWVEIDPTLAASDYGFRVAQPPRSP